MRSDAAERHFLYHFINCDRQSPKTVSIKATAFEENGGMLAARKLSREEG